MKQLFLLLSLFLITMMNMNAQERESIVLIETDLGNIKVKLYNETPKHRDNFLKLVQEGFYQDLLFHRVIENFMIQGGDPDSRNAADTTFLGEGDLDYMVDAEFKTPTLFHKRGALSAARLGDDMNPEKASSACQFYIVTGEKVSENKLKMLKKQRFEGLKIELLKKLQAENSTKVKELYKAGDRQALSEFREGLQAQAGLEAEGRKIETSFSPKQVEIYTTVGGTPMLDGNYTVFGEVIEGMDIVDKIQSVDTNRHDRPKANIRMKMSIIEN